MFVMFRNFKRERVTRRILNKSCHLEPVSRKKFCPTMGFLKQFLRFKKNFDDQLMLEKHLLLRKQLGNYQSIFSFGPNKQQNVTLTIYEYTSFPVNLQTVICLTFIHVCISTVQLSTIITKCYHTNFI